MSQNPREGVDDQGHWLGERSWGQKTIKFLCDELVNCESWLFIPAKGVLESIVKC